MIKFSLSFPEIRRFVEKAFEFISLSLCISAFACMWVDNKICGTIESIECMSKCEPQLMNCKHHLRGCNKRALCTACTDCMQLMYVLRLVVQAVLELTGVANAQYTVN